MRLRSGGDHLPASCQGVVGDSANAVVPPVFASYPTMIETINATCPVLSGVV